MNDDPQESPRARPPRPVTFTELTAGLIWPRLFRSVVMALQPGRMLLAVGLVVVLGALASVYDWVLGLVGAEPVAGSILTGISEGLATFSGHLLALRFVPALDALYQGVFGGPLDLISTHWISTPIFLVLGLIAWTVFGGAISRMVAVDVAGHLSMSPVDALAFAASRATSFVGALLMPLLALVLLALLLSLAGWVLLVIPALNTVGALLYILLLLIGLLTMFLVVSFVVGQALLVPAVAAEGSDSLDALQRGYAYIWGRPARTLGYLGFSLAQGVVVFALARWFVTGAVDMTGALATAWLGESATQAIALDPDGESSMPARLIAGWGEIVRLILPAFVISFYFAASTITYMLLRRINDEQDIHDVWMPGLSPGTLAPDPPPADASTQTDAD